MKQLRTQQQSSHQNSKAWASLDCLLTTVPIRPLSRSIILMRSNEILPMTDTRRLSPQTTSSSGYHSDLSSATSANESPQSIHEIEKSTSSYIQPKKSILITTNPTYEKAPIVNKNLSRISSFIRKQYERAKTKLLSKPVSSSSTSSTQMTSSAIVRTTCTKATSTTPISHISDENYISPSSTQKPYYFSSVYRKDSYTEPVYSVYVHPLHHNNNNNQIKIRTPYQSKNYASIHECYSHQPSYPYSTRNSSSYRRLATMSNFDNNLRRHHYYPVQTSSCYRYTNNNYDYDYNYNRSSNYVPLSDFVSTSNSAFKPIKQKQYYQRPVTNNLYEHVPPSNDPCDLEVAQYFPQTAHWSNPNYFDIYSNDTNLSKQNYTETLC